MKSCKSHEKNKTKNIRVLCPIHVVTFTLISNLATDHIQKRRGEPGLFSFEYNLSPNQSKSDYKNTTKYYKKSSYLNVNDVWKCDRKWFSDEIVSWVWRLISACCNQVLQHKFSSILLLYIYSIYLTQSFQERIKLRYIKIYSK
mgnify:CR=1 FL=1